MLDTQVADERGAIDLLRLAINLNVDGDHEVFRKILSNVKMVQDFDDLAELDTHLNSKAFDELS